MLFGNHKEDGQEMYCLPLGHVLKQGILHLDSAARPQAVGVFLHPVTRVKFKRSYNTIIQITTFSGFLKYLYFLDWTLIQPL